MNDHWLHTGSNGNQNKMHQTSEGWKKKKMLTYNFYLVKISFKNKGWKTFTGKKKKPAKQISTSESPLKILKLKGKDIRWKFRSSGRKSTRNAKYVHKYKGLFFPSLFLQSIYPHLKQKFHYGFGNIIVRRTIYTHIQYLTIINISSHTIMTWI